MEAGSVKHAVREACNLAEVLLPSVLPRRLKCYSAGCRFVVYTDGAYENGRATWGAIVWDKQLPHPIMFWGVVPAPLLQFWLANAGSQVICDVELYAYVLVRWQLRHQLQDELGTSFIDNESARYLLIKHSSQSPCMRSVICALSLLDAVHPFGSWHE